MITYKFLLLLILLANGPVLSAESQTFRLWPQDAPGDINGEIGPEELMKPKEPAKDVLRIKNVSDPTFTLFPATSKKSDGVAVIVCPGGGYNILAYEHEGTQVCEWLNQLGVTAILLKYRVPRRKNRPPYEAPLQDAQRAVGMIRQNAKKWDLNPNKIGILGFSAGGNLAMMTLTSFEKRTYESIDQADNFSCRPDFGILIYPAYLVDRKERKSLFPEIRISSNTPPCFFAHTGDDNVPAEGSVLAYLALERAGVVGSELHIYPYGGHGYGMRKSQNPVANWPGRAEDWMKSLKLIP